MTGEEHALRVKMIETLRGLNAQGLNQEPPQSFPSGSVSTHADHAERHAL